MNKRQKKKQAKKSNSYGMWKTAQSIKLFGRALRKLKGAMIIENKVNV